MKKTNFPNKWWAAAGFLSSYVMFFICFHGKIIWWGVHDRPWRVLGRGVIQREDQLDSCRSRVSSRARGLQAGGGETDSEGSLQQLPTCIDKLSDISREFQFQFSFKYSINTVSQGWHGSQFFNVLKCSVCVFPKEILQETLLCMPFTGSKKHVIGLAVYPPEPIDLPRHDNT